MEYNVDLLDGLDIYGENALTLILKQIVPGSRVLEFGPAYGRMTRFMKENLGCKVDCVEINPKAETQLQKYAEKAFIGNIEDYVWEKEFEKNQYDFVVFADVLEHLNNPTEVLKRVIPFLEVNGRILLSVPNIAHNVIIQSLYMNHFQYQDCGILDNTHVRFFAKDTLEKMVSDSGLYVDVRLATYYYDDMTGVLESDYEKNEDLISALSQREYANVYQFVYTLCKEPVEAEKCLEEKAAKDVVKIYFDRGKGFSEEDMHEIHVDFQQDELCEVFFENNEFINSLRIDPSESSCICCIKEISVTDLENNTRSVPLEELNHNALYKYDDIFIFEDNDPYIVIQDVNAGLSSIKISVQILYSNISSSRLSRLFCEGIRCIIREKSDVSNQNENLIIDRRELEERALRIAELSAVIRTARDESEQKNDKIARLSAELENARDESEMRGLKIAELNASIINIQNESEQKNTEIAKLRSELMNIQQESEERAQKIAGLTYELECIQAELIKKDEKIFGKNLELVELQDRIRRL